MRWITLAGLGAFAALWSVCTPAAEPGRTLFIAADVVREREVGSPAVSPDGTWVAYTVTAGNPERDEQDTDLWMASWDGAANLRLTSTPGGETRPAWSPDGRYLAFLAARETGEKGRDESPTQVWLLDRRGGEAQVLTDFRGDVAEFAWSPDGKSLAVIAWDEDVAWRKQAKDGETQPPIVIDRFYFKEDYTGYMGPERKRLYLVDLASRTARRLTSSPHNEKRPAWSADGGRIAFLGTEEADPDRNGTSTLYMLDIREGAKPRALAQLQGESGDASWIRAPAWSPDGRRIAFAGGGDPRLIGYATHRAFLVDVEGGRVRPLGAALDRNMEKPRWSPDGQQVYVLLEDDGRQHLARIGIADDRIERVLDGRRETLDYDIGRTGRIALLDGTVDQPYEVFALEPGAPRPLSRQNDAWLAGKRIAPAEEISFRSKDGTEIHGFLVKPAGYRKGRRYPAILRLHGGPVWQWANRFESDWQVLASSGYAVIAPNPRGSSGRGQDFAKAIFADWGNKDSEDALAAVDHVVDAGIADPARLGVGGWSYGGMLTIQLTARDPRFKAASAGAGTASAFANYGTDMYIRDLETELGTPWHNTDAYLRVSYPFLHADRIATPTLFLCGEKDFNVPVLNSEQMYQALKSRGVDTRLVIYPGQYHGLDVPSYRVDRMQRNLDWYEKYL
jgi:dipeptidyl aminopeptidase/acylaminoacyl peptidase